MKRLYDLANLTLLFLAGLFIRGTVRIALGDSTLLPLKAMLPALIGLALILVFFFWRLMMLPGKLIRGDI